MLRFSEKNRALAVLNVIILCVVIFAVSSHFTHQAKLIGLVLIALAILSLLSLWLFRISIASTQPDIIFGVIDNGILAVFAVVGAEYAGVLGAIIGGVVGNAITDGIAGMLEGYWAEGSVHNRRTILGSAVGKMAGCLLGAGVVLAIAGIFGI